MATIVSATGLSEEEVNSWLVKAWASQKDSADEQPVTNWLSKSSGEYLVELWFAQHSSHPYPTRKEKQQMLQLTGLTKQQLTNWFRNARIKFRTTTGQDYDTRKLPQSSVDYLSKCLADRSRGLQTNQDIHREWFNLAIQKEASGSALCCLGRVMQQAAADECIHGVAQSLRSEYRVK
jgi:hypothetical protein